jgi:hypothetical protein
MADSNKANSQASESKQAGDKANDVPKPVMESRSKYAKQGWGSWSEFMHSYQLKRKYEMDRSVSHASPVIDYLQHGKQTM